MISPLFAAQGGEKMEKAPCSALWCSTGKWLAFLKIPSVGGVARSAGVGWFPCPKTPLKSPLVQGGTRVLSNVVQQRGMKLLQKTSSSSSSGLSATESLVRGRGRRSAYSSCIHASPTAVMITSMILIPMNGMITPPTP